MLGLKEVFALAKIGEEFLSWSFSIEQMRYIKQKN